MGKGGQNMNTNQHDLLKQEYQHRDEFVRHEFYLVKEQQWHTPRYVKVIHFVFV